MRLAHFADTHLGFRQLNRIDPDGRNIRELDVYKAFERAIDLIIEMQPNCVIHAGDLFDSYHPSSAALAAALDGFARLREAELPVVVISGNHSTPRVSAADHVFGILERFGGIHAVHTDARMIEVEGLAVHAVPHYNDPDALADALRSARPSPDADFNVLVAHVGLGGLDGLGQAGIAESGAVTLSGETIEAGKDFDYIALGHLHEFGGARRNAAYSGSLERLTWADKADAKGVAEVDLTRDPAARDFVRLRPIETRRQLRLAPIDAAAVDDLTGALLRVADTADIAGAMIRQPIRNVTVAAYGAIDRRALDRAFKDCLHLELVPQLIGDTTPTEAPQELRDFLAARAPAGMDANDFIARAEAYMAQASQQIGAGS